MDLVRNLLQRGPFEFIDLADAKARWAAFRGTHGAAPTATKLLSEPADNAKLNKTAKGGKLVWSLSLAQADSAYGINTCRYSTPGCRQGCVSFAGKGELATVQNGRIRKTLFLYAEPEAFLTLLMHELIVLWAKHGTDMSVRLNTFSDIPWEDVCPEIFERFPLVQFYDYTKWSLGSRSLPANYTLTQSASEHTADSSILLATHHDENVAVIFDTKRGQDLPVTFLGVRVIDGDKSDHRPSDPHGVIVGLRAKGRMRKGNPMVRKVEVFA